MFYFMYTFLWFIISKTAFWNDFIFETMNTFFTLQRLVLL